MAFSCTPPSNCFNCMQIGRRAAGAGDHWAGPRWLPACCHQQPVIRYNWPHGRPAPSWSHMVSTLCFIDHPPRSWSHHGSAMGEVHLMPPYLAWHQAIPTATFSTCTTKMVTDVLFRAAALRTLTLISVACENLAGQYWKLKFKVKIECGGKLVLSVDSGVWLELGQRIDQWVSGLGGNGQNKQCNRPRVAGTEGCGPNKPIIALISIASSDPIKWHSINCIEPL